MDADEHKIAGSYRGLYEASPVERVRMIRAGVPAKQAKALLGALDIGQVKGLAFLNISPATVNRKAAAGGNLSPEETERLMGVAKLIGQIETIVAQSGAPNSFDAVSWLGRWLQEPLAALGGVRPLELMDTMEGQSLVSDTLARAQSAAYG